MTTRATLRSGAWCTTSSMRTARRRGEAKAAMHPGLEAAIHLFLANRGILLAPFHNMMLVSPVTSDDQIDRLVGGFADCTKALKE